MKKDHPEESLSGLASLISQGKSIANPTRVMIALPTESGTYHFSFTLEQARDLATKLAALRHPR